MTTAEHEVVVLGGGPAGCAAATLLAQRAHDVALVRPAEPPAAELAESIPPSARRILDELGMLDAVARRGFQANLGNVVWWAGAPPRDERFAADEAGFHVTRRDLEETLCAVAARSGVTVLEGTSARRADEVADGWIVTCEGDGGVFALRARWIVDATGRRGVVARLEGREPDRSTTTLALLRRWRRAEGWLRHEGQTCIESYDEGWAWSVPIDRETRCFTVMIDPRGDVVAGGDVSAALDRELDRTRMLGALREGAHPAGQAWACPASLYTSRRFGRAGLLMAGDAGSFIDPLSSFGVKKALSSGWLAAITAHTALVDPPMTGHAVDFFDRREREVYRRYRRASADFFQSAAEAHDTDYWHDRARAAWSASGEAPGDGRDGVHDPEGAIPGTVDSPVSEDQVRAAFEGIRNRQELRAVVARGVRTEERASIEGHRIVLSDHLVSEMVPDGVRFVRGVDLLRLSEVAPRHADVPDGWAQYNNVAPPVTLPDYLTALATAFAAGLLEHRDEASG